VSGEAVAATAANPWINAASTVLGTALKPAGAGPSSADSVFSTNLAFDNSGWNVSLGDNSGIDSTASKTTDQGGATGGAKGFTGYLPWGILFVGALIAFKALKK